MPTRRTLLIALGPLAAAALIAGTLVLVSHARDSGRGAIAAPSDPVILVVGPDRVHQSVFDARVSVAVTAAQQGGGPQSSDPQYPQFLASIRARVLQSLIIDTVIAQEARTRGVAATDADVEKEVTADTSIAGGGAQLATQLAEAGGSVAQLRDETRSRLNEAQLEDLLASQRAADALVQIKSGTDFGTVAQAYSDDQTSIGKGGDLGSLSLDQLKGGDSAFLNALTALKVGQITDPPARDAAGYEILRVDAATATARSAHRILVAAPQPYTEKERPDWFTQAVLLAVSTDCSSGSIQVLLANAGQPCGTSTPTAAPGSPGVPATPGASPSGTAGTGFVPRPAPTPPSATPTPTG